MVVDLVEILYLCRSNKHIKGLTTFSDMQGRFLELQSLLKRYGSEGTGDARNSPKKPGKAADQKTSHIQVNPRS